LKSKNLTIRLDQNLYDQVKQASESEGVSLGEIVRNTIARRFRANARETNGSQQNLNIEWFKAEMESKNKQLEASAIARKADQALHHELQAEKKALYDKLEN